MSFPEYCTTEKLAEVFGRCQEEIIGDWRTHAGELLRERNLDKPTITDHLPDLVAEITRDLALGRDGTISVEQTRGSPLVHGVQRFHDGLDVGEVVAEYNLLRIAFFITIADRHGLYVVGEAARIINHRIDEGVRLAVMAFAAQQALIRKEQEDEDLAFIAHDLRTPLNAVSLLVEELKAYLGLNLLPLMTLITTALGLAAPLALHAEPVQARAADAFVDSIGVNIHLHFNDTIYGDFSKVKSALEDVGVRHVRDGLVDSGWSPYFERINDLAAAGIKFTFITSLPLDRLAPVAEKVRPAIEAFEGPNEVNLNKWTVEKSRTYQRDLWQTVKAGAFAKTPVIALSVTDFKWAKELGDLSAWCDFGNVHPYPGGWEPENGANWMRADLASGIETARANCGTKPIMITETGYHSATPGSGGHIPVSERAAGIYLPRLFLHTYRSGIVRTFWYEFLNSRNSATDPEGNFGLYKNDGVTIKPAGRALKHLIALLADPGPAVSPGSLDFTLSDSQAQSVLLQKRNGEFWLALWLKSTLWDNFRPFGQKQEVDPKDSECTVTLKGNFTSVTAHEHLDAETPRKRAITDTKSSTVTLSARVLLLQITPAAR